MAQRIPRPAARILLVDQQGRLLMFRFTPEDGRPPFWCTPGGAVDPGESFGRKNHGRVHRSTSPNTMSNVPMMATTSASICPLHSSSIADRCANPGALIFIRHGLLAPSETR